MSKIVIVDYMLGNLYNVQRAFKSMGTKTLITNKKEDLRIADKIVLPGVGAFGEGMKHLKQTGLDKIIKEAANQGKPILGICLGMQLLMSESEELGKWEGLNLVPGKVVRFDPPRADNKFKIPQIGWNKLIPSHSQEENNKKLWEETILHGIKEDTYMYFIHSYYVQVENPEDSVADACYGHNRFCSVVQKNNVIGCQFHPERSAEEGINILKNFISMV